MARLLTHAEIDWRADGTPVARAVGDVYFSAGEGLAETRAVFLGGCGLPDGWAGRERFTIAETGFGTGLSFLAAWQAWRAHRPSPTARLTFISFEGFPMRAEDAARAQAAWPELAGLAAQLVAAWPTPVRGVRSIAFPGDGVTLHLHLGDIAVTLPQADFQADAWFLDGFSPARNADMWDAALYPLIAGRSAAGARAASYTVAGHVRSGLADAGFAVTRAPGHGRKRQRLEARLVTAPPRLVDRFGLYGPVRAASRVAILGAGIAGASAAHACTLAGLSVTVFDPATAIASGASGNPLALLMPRFDAADTPAARLLIDTYFTARALYRTLPGAAETEVCQAPQDRAEAARFARLLADPPFPLEDLEALAGGGLLHKGALILRPRQIIAALLEGSGRQIGAPVVVDLAELTVNGAPFDAIILANGIALRALAEWTALEGRLGQVEWLTGRVPAPPSALASGHYALAADGDRLWGASFEPIADGVAFLISDRARTENLDALSRLSPWWVREASAGAASSRASVRATTADRLPLIGALPDADRAREVFAGLRTGRDVVADAPLVPGVFVAGGYGARGFTWGPWAGQVLAARLAGLPVPASIAVQQAVSPMRVLLRALRKGG